MGFSHCDSDEHEVLYSSNIVPVRMFISHVTENNLHKQQCIVGLARSTMCFNNLYY